MKNKIMKRYIDANEFEKRIKPYDTDDIIDRALYNFAHNKMMEAPTADVRENVHGKWLYTDDLYETPFCSVCKWESLDYLEFNYCPNCGADMRKGE